jgi:peptidylprolyl isomerase
MSAQKSGKKTSAAEAAAAKRKSQALIGAGAGVAVIAVLIGIFVAVRSADDEPVAAPAPASAATTPAPDAGAGDPGSAQPTPEAPARPGAVETPPALKTAPVVKAGTGALPKLKVTPLIVGTGPAVTKGQTITVNYSGVNYKTGKPFQSSWDSGQPFSTEIGVGRVIPGWDQGLVGVKVGSRVQLDIPTELAYGENPQGGAPAGDLRFVVDILAAQ